MRKYIAIGLCLVFIAGLRPNPSFATGIATGVTISSLQINTTIGDYLFIAVSGTVSGPAACSTNTAYQFVLNLSTNEGQQTMALLLAARASQATVTIIGTGDCTSGFSTVETLGSIQY